MLTSISRFCALRALDVLFIDRQCYDEYWLSPGRIQSLSSAFVDALHAHFSCAPSPHPMLEEVSLTILYPTARLVEHWTAASTPLASVLCDHAHFRHQWDRTLEDARARGTSLLGAFERGGVEAEVSAEWFCHPEPKAASDDGSDVLLNLHYMPHAQHPVDPRPLRGAPGRGRAHSPSISRTGR
ncbi:uncharacterized protein BXZ73DRAFT_75801 [Epithele typhae]|uniref:uncharacterized protein n=1 Tax=Epithele typhae TaxID=378194 RepID=UPI0020075E13|nr:uncharacterized protein BXZ73DRAFT_75801 [Epithele typhae]KAH9940207.1 hypothetical protein BXZ73DRAFT_75801 [Epithele typhae]